MLVLRSSALIALALAVCSCSRLEAPKPPARGVEAARSGWVEFALVDHRVPADPVEKRAGRPAQPPRCVLAVDLDGESVLSEMIRPMGDEPPYSVESLFRFPAPPGEHAAVVYYSGCRTFDNRLDSVEAALRISIRSHHVTRIRFDGSVLSADAPSAAQPAPAAGGPH